MITGFYRCGMVAVFPNITFTILAVIVFLAKSSGNELLRSGHGLYFGCIGNDEVNRVADDGEMQNGQVIPIPGFKQEIKPAIAVSGKLKQEFPLMASVG